MPSLPSTGFSRTEFPGFVGTIRALRLPAARPAALRFLRLAVPLTDACSFAATGGKRQTPVARGTLVTRFAPISRGFVRKRQGLPRSWGTPIVPMPCSATPAGPITPGHSRCVGTAPVQTTTKAPAGMSLEAQSHGLGTRCLRFAGGITPPPRKTRFRLPARLYRTGLIPAGFQRKVSEMSPTWLILRMALPLPFGVYWREHSSDARGFRLKSVVR